MKDRILLVDDETPVLKVYGDMLRRFGFLVDEAETFDRAVDLLRRYSYKAAIFDLQLSNGDRYEGLELSGIASAHQPDIRIILLTAYGNAEIRNRAKEIGVDCYLEKPVSTKVILGTLLNLKPAKE